MIESRVDFRGLQRALREVDRALGKDMNRTIVAAVNNSGIVESARSRFPQKSGRGARSIRAQASPRGARITAGGSRAPHVPWIEFGGSIPRRGGGVSRRPVVRGGRYITPEVMANRDRVVRIIENDLSGFLSKL